MYICLKIYKNISRIEHKNSLYSTELFTTIFLNYNLNPKFLQILLDASLEILLFGNNVVNHWSYGRTLLPLILCNQDVKSIYLNIQRFVFSIGVILNFN